MVKKPSKIKGLFVLDKLFIYDTMEVQKGLTMKYNYFWVEGYWDDDPIKNINEYKISTDPWDGKFDSDDEQIFYYLDKDDKINVGEVLTDGFTITKIHRKD